ncbi:MAG: endolytic transglycosylase MltG [Alphaproteobacteria bacterium]
MSETPEMPETAPRRRRGLGWTVSLFVLLLIVAATVAGGGFVMLHRAYTDLGPLVSNTVVVIPPGSSGREIVRRLTDAGIASDPGLARLALRLFASERPLRAGEYAFPASISLKAAIGKLQDGDTVVRRVTIAEGLTTREALAVLSQAEGLEGNAPEPTEVGEGSLLPETYHFSLGDTRADVVARMQAAMHEAIATEWAGRDEGLPLASPAEALILASIVEKETAVPSERPRVAAVFINRLKRGMRLQSDPTVAYGFSTEEGEFSGRLLNKHLETNHPFNTYTRDGLPPAPIANPGRESIAAVLHPAETKDFYFVADGSGGHAFARTLAEHNHNVAKWRRIQRERRNSAR